MNQEIDDDFELNKALWSPCFIYKIFSALKVLDSHTSPPPIKYIVPFGDEGVHKPLCKVAYVSFRPHT